MYGQFLKQTFPPILICLGLTGNIFTLIIFSRKNLSKISKLLRILTISDSFGVLNIAQHYLDNTFEINIRTFSDFSCQGFEYLAYIFLPISAWLLVYVCIERFFMIKYPSRYKFLQRSLVRMSIVSMIIISNLAFYTMIFFGVKVFETVSQDMFNNSITDLICYPTYEHYMYIFVTLDIINSTILPSCLMIVNTGLLIFALFQSRSKFFCPNPSKQEKKRKKKDIQFALSCISLNIIFLVMNIPNRLNTLITRDITSDTYYLLDNMYYSNFGLSFLIHFISNRNFRQEVLTCLCKIKNYSN